MNRLIFTGCVLFVTTILFSCKKNGADVPNSGTLQQKVIEWLGKQQTPQQTDRTTITDNIKQHLQWGQTMNAGHVNGKKLWAVPIGAGFHSKNNSKKNVHNYLILFEDGAGAIKYGHILQAVDGAMVTSNTFAAFYENRGPGVNGTYCTLSIHDVFLQQLTFDNNRLKESLSPQAKPKDAARNTTDNCIDWYVVTTFYNPETGAVIGQAETYIGTSCNGCVPYTGTPQTTITGQTEWDCNTGGGGGGDAECQNAASTFDEATESIAPQNQFSLLADTNGGEVYHVVTWIVSRQYVNMWRVKAKTECRYKGYYEGGVYKTDVRQVSTFHSGYEGTNHVVNTTWAQTGKDDHIYNNNTALVTSVSTVNGELKHKMDLPLCNRSLRRTDIVTGSMTLEYKG